MIKDVHDMTCLIHRMEDKLLRSKDFQEQLRINTVLRNYRKQLQVMIWEAEKKTITN